VGWPRRESCKPQKIFVEGFLTGGPLSIWRGVHVDISVGLVKPFLTHPSLLAGNFRFVNGVYYKQDAGRSFGGPASVACPLAGHVQTAIRDAQSAVCAFRYSRKRAVEPGRTDRQIVTSSP
jgi:hypothetical protein